MKVELPTATMCQLREFTQRSRTLYNDYVHAKKTVPAIAKSPWVKELDLCTELVVGLSSDFKESDEPGEIVPEIIKIMSESYTPILMRLIEYSENFWLSMQLAICDDDLDAAFEAFDRYGSLLSEDGLLDELTANRNRLIELEL